MLVHERDFNIVRVCVVTCRVWVHDMLSAAKAFGAGEIRVRSLKDGLSCYLQEI